MKKILLIGERFSPNLGDGIIYEVTEYFLKDDFEIVCLDFAGKKDYLVQNENSSFNPMKEKKIFFKAKLRKIMNYFNINMGANNNDPLIKNYKKELIKILDNTRIDAIVFAGGQMFMDCFIDKLLFTINNANKYSIPIIFNACGKGNISKSSKMDKIINSNIVTYISVRDGYEYLKKFDQQHKIVETYDTAILANNVYHKSITNNKLGIGIMITHNVSLNKQIKFWKSIILFCIDNCIDWEIFCNGNLDDYNFGKYILNELGLNDGYISKRPTSHNMLVNTITKYEKIISMRMHSLIIAYSFRIPALAISWDKKVDEFYKKINKEQYCYHFDDDINNILNSLKKQNNDFDDGLFLNIEDSINKNIIEIKKIINKM